MGMRDAEPTTVYVLGAAGQLGSALRARLAAARLQARVKWLTSADVDIADGSSVDAALRGLAGGDVVLNCAAYTDVDGAESDRAGAFLVNAEGPANLARATAPAGAWLIHISTDYVFSDAAAGATATGGTRHPFEPDDSTSVTPATVYGASKLAGERAALAADPRTTVVRTAWVYTGTEASKDFVGTMRRLERTRESVSVVDDQLGSPTYALDLAAGLWELAAAGPSERVAGAVLHATNAGEATWFDVARAVFADVGASPDRVLPCTTAEFPRPAPRPAYSVLSQASWTSAGLTPLRGWRAALDEAIAAPAPESSSLP